MRPIVRTKICGLTRPEDVAAAVQAGASYVGFVFFERSPRNLDLAAARALALEVPPGIAKVGLTVDAQDEALDAILAEVPLDMLQLHGQESPARVAEVRTRQRLPVMKAVGLADAADLSQIDRYAGIADQILVDAKPAAAGALPGGNGLAFDWRLLEGRQWSVPWMLAGGLTPDNVGAALRLTGARQVDVSSGVETAPGLKDSRKIAAFLAATKGERDA